MEEARPQNKPVRYAHFEWGRLTTIKNGERISKHIETVAFGTEDESEPTHEHPALGRSDNYWNKHPATLQQLKAKGYLNGNTFDYDKAAEDSEVPDKE